MKLAQVGLVSLVLIGLLLVACGRRGGQGAAPGREAPAPSLPTAAPVATSAARPASTPVPPTSAPPSGLSDRIGAVDNINYRDKRGSFPELALAKNAGIGWIRTGIPWSEVEPRQGQFEWQVPDAFVAQARSQGLQLLIILNSSPRWISTRSGIRGHLAPPKDYSLWGNYVYQTVSRYKRDVHYWEIWNEPDLVGSWPGTPGEYAQLLAVAYQSVKRADPSAQVLFAGLALNDSPRENPRFFQEVLADPSYPGTRSFDIANIHVYGPLSEAQRRLAGTRATLEQAGVGDRPIWVTETGYSDDPGYQQVPEFKGPQGQVEYLRTVVPYLLQQGAAKVFWYQLYDFATAGGGFKNYGLLDEQLRPKPAYTALRSLIEAER